MEEKKELSVGPSDDATLFNTMSIRGDKVEKRGKLTTAEAIRAENLSPGGELIDSIQFKNDTEYQDYVSQLVDIRYERGREFGRKEERLSPSTRFLLLACVIGAMMFLFSFITPSGNMFANSDLKRACQVLNDGCGSPATYGFDSKAYETFLAFALVLFPTSSPLPLVRGAYPPSGGCVRVNGPFNSTGDKEIIGSLIHHASSNGFGAISSPRLDRPYCVLVTGFTVMLNPEIVMVNTRSVLEAEENAPLTCPENEMYKMTRSGHVMVQYENSDHDTLLLEIKDLATAWALQSEITYLNRGLSPCNGDSGLQTTIETLSNKF